MQKNIFILVFAFMGLTTFAQTQTVDSTVVIKQETVQQPTPYYGVYEDLEDMKSRFKAYIQLQKEEKKVAEMPQDELLWEAAKGPDDFKGPKMINAYSVNKPAGYASDIEEGKLDKDELGKTIQTSLILSKSPADKSGDNWERKLIKN
ncbi:MAG: hypothetical protein KDC85_19780 [Saprospiraceae bacterium]|nr:hypothetical protein [Saprospiraceae bacterium]MCB9324625.1 hypothetical protein [Lewinellaceae bacterium]